MLYIVCKPCTLENGSTMRDILLKDVDMVNKLSFIQATFLMLMLLPGQVCAGWQSQDEKMQALEVHGLHVNNAPLEYPGLVADIYSLPISYQVNSGLDQHGLWRGANAICSSFL